MAEFDWVVCNPTDAEREAFGDPQRALALTGTVINANPMSSLRKVHLDGRNYYLKAYEGAGRWLRRHVGRSRVHAEWDNLLFFDRIGLPTARVVAYGEQQGWAADRKGVLITEEIPATTDLASVMGQDLTDKDWLDRVVCRLARHVRTMHAHHFIHHDLKWRNVLVEFSQDPEVYIIDCPLGRRLYGPFFRRGIIKDLACLDKVAKYRVSGSVRLRFYKKYRGISRLDRADRRRIRKIRGFFEGRE